TWIFAVDGDEIYDPNGLVKMRSKILNGEFANTWAIFGNVLNCIELNFKNCTTKGYLAPPCRSMTKLYNFSLIESWTGCPERLHGGELIFKNKESHELRRYLHTEYDWDDAYFRCIHTVFIPRSSLEKNKRRRNPFEMEQIQNIHKQNFSLGYFKLILKSFLGLDWKNQKYRRGKLVEKDISAFL
ncbi:MAG: hypothetical protein NT121_01195, partial [Chloroflexi bacterium]|nr:hypothetical protein [Chloroflexota bacterium]